MRKRLLKFLTINALMITSCSSMTTKFNIIEYTYGTRYPAMGISSNDNVYLARCSGDIYVEIPETYYQTSINLKKVDEIKWYRISTLAYKVSNKGWEY